MPQSTVTFILNNNTYQLSADNAGAIRNIPKTDREQLISLLEAIKKQDQQAQIAVQEAMAKAQIPIPAATTVTMTEDQIDQQQINPARLSSSEADEMMARLIMEERSNQKPGLTTQSLYKFIAGFAFIVLLLILLF